jgi:antagonist of KipI
VIAVNRAPPYLTVQDAGRKHSRASGVPSGGAVDAFALAAANALVGNRADAAGLEWALGGGSLIFERDVTFSLGGATARATLSGQAVAPFTTVHARAGDELAVDQITNGRFLYLAFGGGIDVPVVLGSRSTYLPARFGGYHGRTIKRGDSLALAPTAGKPPADGFHCAADLLPRYGAEVVHISRGTHAGLFDEAAWRTLTDSEYKISTASDRTGYRLEGASLGNSAGALPSEAGCPGSIQVPGDGLPIALMADAPTVGGYPKIAVVAEADLPILAQRSPGDAIRFDLVTIEQSQRSLRRRASDLHTISQLAIRSSR